MAGEASEKIIGELLVMPRERPRVDRTPPIRSEGRTPRQVASERRRMTNPGGKDLEHPLDPYIPEQWRSRADDIKHAQQLLVRSQAACAAGTREDLQEALLLEAAAMEKLGGLGQTFDVLFSGHVRGYASEREPFATQSHGSSFVHLALQNTKVNSGPVIDLGAGVGNDAEAVARRAINVVAVDSSEVAVRIIRKRADVLLREEGGQKTGKITVIHDELSNYANQPLSAGSRARLVLMISVLHLLPKALRQQLLWDICRNILDQRGTIAVAMKLREGSDSASTDHNLILTGPPENYSLGFEDGLLRAFPEEETALDDLMRSVGLEVRDCFTDCVEGYDRKGKIERFRYVRATVPNGGNGGEKK